MPTRLFTANQYSDNEYAEIKKLIGKHKTIPPQFEKQILLALTYFPELVDADIVFRIRHVRTPLATRPAWTSIVRANRQRKYVITISNHTMQPLSPILLERLDFNAQVGVLGHELSHVADFSSHNSFGLMRIGLGHLSTKYIDHMEFKTDSICVTHGLGYQLLSWSMFVRKVIHQKNYEGADFIEDKVMTRERYMNPSTIRKHIAAKAIYSNI